MQPKKAFSVNYKRACSFLLNKPQTEKKMGHRTAPVRVRQIGVMCCCFLAQKNFQRIVKEVRVVEEMFEGQYAVLVSVTGNSYGKRTTIVILSK